MNSQPESTKAASQLKHGLAQMLKGGTIMDVTNPEQARIAEQAGAAAVMALERIPADVRKAGGVARMSDPQMIREIQRAVSIPVMAKCRIGHFVEAQILQHLGVDFIDESEVLTPADDVHHINKWSFQAPFVCGCRDLGEALRRVSEGAAMIRTKGEAGTGNVVEAVRHARQVVQDIGNLRSHLPRDISSREILGHDPSELKAFKSTGEMMQLDLSECPVQLWAASKELRAPIELVFRSALMGRLPVVNFAAGGVATPADAALMMALGLDGVFVGSGIFKSAQPEKRAKAIVQSVTHWKDPSVLAEVSTDLGEAMVGIDMDEAIQKYAQRGQ